MAINSETSEVHSGMSNCKSVNNVNSARSHSTTFVTYDTEALHGTLLHWIEERSSLTLVPTNNSTSAFVSNFQMEIISLRMGCAMSMKQISLVSIAGKCQKVENEGESREKFLIDKRRFHSTYQLNEKRIEMKTENSLSSYKYLNKICWKKKEREVFKWNKREFHFNCEIDYWNVSRLKQEKENFFVIFEG